MAHIVEATTRVLARQGYANTSLMDIAKEAGMSKGAVHYHFPTKESLMTVVLKTALESVYRRTIQAWSAGKDPFESMRVAVQEMWRFRAELSNEASVIADLLAQSLHDTKLREPLAEYYKVATAQVQDHLRENLSKVGLKSKLPLETVPRMMNALLDGFFMQHIVDPEAVREDVVINVLQTLASLLFEFDQGRVPEAPDSGRSADPIS
ncbi:MAG: TetR/AcrR family transcriptional regulator [Deltaproteobacteria bacterium]|nr:TetR/AcrR family transcriptional regulator [Deltaproteobacteria bacterium]